MNDQKAKNEKKALFACIKNCNGSFCINGRLQDIGNLDWLEMMNGEYSTLKPCKLSGILKRSTVLETKNSIISV